jgi:hypothetical protein
MPNLTKATENARIIQMIQILGLMSRGKTQQEACAQIGMSPDTFRDWVARDSDAIAMIREVISETERVQLANVVQAENFILSKIIEEAMDDERSSFFIRLKVYELLTKLRKELEAKHGVDTKEDQAGIVLNGPQLQQQDSMIPPSYTTVNVRPKSDGSVDINLPIKKDVIESEFQDEGQDTLSE